MDELRLTKVTAGWYATEDGTMAVINDGIGYVTIAEREGSGISAGITGGEWAPIIDPQGRLRQDNGVGQNMDWFSTKREAVEWLERWGARELASMKERMQ